VKSSSKEKKKHAKKEHEKSTQKGETQNKNRMRARDAGWTGGYPGCLERSAVSALLWGARVPNTNQYPGYPLAQYITLGTE
jgi:hypothetical protein